VRQQFKSYIEIAYKQAKIAFKKSEVPVGCAIIDRGTGQILAKTHNLCESKNNPTLHAEIVAISLACKKINNKNLSNCDIYITLEPCAMCASAISHAKIKRVYYSAPDEKQGAVENGIRFFNSKSCLHRPEIYSGIMKNESETLLRDFFAKLRIK
jgi:tRNA(Arg) A34 adenosine deaminase TadA